MHAVLEQHTALVLELERFWRFARVVLLEPGEPHLAQIAAVAPPEHVLEPRSEAMVLVDDKGFRIAGQRRDQRFGLLDAIGERLLADDVDAGARRAQAVRGVQGRRRQDVHEIDRRGREQLVEAREQPRLGHELLPSFFCTAAIRIDQRDNLDFRDAAPAAEMERRNVAAADDGAAERHDRPPGRGIPRCPEMGRDSLANDIEPRPRARRASS